MLVEHCVKVTMSRDWPTRRSSDCNTSIPTGSQSLKMPTRLSGSRWTCRATSALSDAGSTPSMTSSPEVLRVWRHRGRWTGAVSSCSQASEWRDTARPRSRVYTPAGDHDVTMSLSLTSVRTTHTSLLIEMCQTAHRADGTFRETCLGLYTRHNAGCCYHVYKTDVIEVMSDNWWVSSKCNTVYTWSAGRVWWSHGPSGTRFCDALRSSPTSRCDRQLSRTWTPRLADWHE